MGGKVTTPAPWPTGHYKPYEGPKKLLDPKDPRWPIFGQLYLVRVPVLQMRSVEDIREFGVPISGDDPTDKMIADEERKVMLPISKLVELNKKGCRIGVVNGPDTRKIYEAISTYLELWKEKMTNRLNLSTAPIEDLLDLDAFAHLIYDRAKWHFDDGFISKHMTEIQNAGVRGLLSAIRVKKQVDPIDREVKGVRLLNPARLTQRQKLEAPELVEGLVEEESDHAPRKSMADFFRPQVGPGGVTVRNVKIQPANTNAEARTSATNRSIENLLGNNRGKPVTD